MHDDDATLPDDPAPDALRARDVVRAKDTLPRRVAGEALVARLGAREQRRPAGNTSKTWTRVAGEDPFVLARLEGDVARATTYVDGRFVRIDQQAKEAARARQGGVPTPPSSWGGGSGNVESSLPAAFRNIPVAAKADGERAPNQGESLIPAGFRDVPYAKPKEQAPSAAEVAAKRRAAEAAGSPLATPGAAPPAPAPMPTLPPRPAHSSTGRAMLNPRARTPIGPVVRPSASAPPPPASLPNASAKTPDAPPTRPPAPVAPNEPTSTGNRPSPPEPDAAARQAQRSAGGSLDDLFQRPAGGTEGRARLGRRGPPGGEPPGGKTDH
jgi:hypothetical protein